MKDDGREAGTIVAAFVLGALTGAAVALLKTPSTGDEMRRIVSYKARESRERVEEAARQGRDFLTRQRDNLTSAVERGREAYQQARTSAAPLPDEGTSWA